MSMNIPCCQCSTIIIRIHVINLIHLALVAPDMSYKTESYFSAHWHSLLIRGHQSLLFTVLLIIFKHILFTITGLNINITTGNILFFITGFHLLDWLLHGHSIVACSQWYIMNCMLPIPGLWRCKTCHPELLFLRWRGANMELISGNDIGSQSIHSLNILFSRASCIHLNHLRLCLWSSTPTTPASTAATTSTATPSYWLVHEKIRVTCGKT